MDRINQPDNQLFSLLAATVLCCLFLYLAEPAVAGVTLTYLPGKELVERVVLENDSVSYTIELDRNVRLSSLLDKTSGIDLMAGRLPLTFCLVSGQGRWDNESEYHVFQIDEQRGEQAVTINIIQQAGSSVQNPLVIRQTFSLAENSFELSWKATVTNTSAAGIDHPEARSIATTAAFPVMQRIAIGRQQDTRYLLPISGTRYCIDSPEDFFFYFTGSQRKMPIDIFNSQLGRGVCFDVRQTACRFIFSGKDDFTSRFFKLSFAPGEEKTLMDCQLRPHPGDWHFAFRRLKELVRSEFDFKYYQRPGQAKYRRSFVSHFTFLFGHDIYDPKRNRFRVPEFFNEAELNFGGFDNMIIWQNYPRLGVDSRDQFDLLEDLPGGLEGLEALVDSAHAREMLVFISYNPWDIVDAEKDHIKELARICRVTGMDGIYLDTMHGLEQKLRDEIDKVNPGIIFSSEGRADIKSARLLTGSWEQADDGPIVMPNIDLLRFVLPEHIVYNTNRIAIEKDKLIYNALFNGTGLTVWEDMFGSINEFSWNDRVLTKRYSRIMHENSDAYLTECPVPLVPTLRKDFFVNAFPSQNKCVYAGYQTGRHEPLYAHRNNMSGAYLEVEHPENWHYIDIWSHRKLKVEKRSGGRTRLIYPVQPAEPMFCILALPQNLQVEQVDGVLKIKAACPLENASIEIMTVDNLTMIEEKVLTVPGNEAVVELSRLKLDYPYKVLVKLMQDGLLKDEVILDLGWKQF